MHIVRTPGLHNMTYVAGRVLGIPGDVEEGRLEVVDAVARLPRPPDLVHKRVVQPAGQAG
jgi:hypothetical protein